MREFIKKSTGIGQDMIVFDGTNIRDIIDIVNLYNNTYSRNNLKVLLDLTTFKYYIYTGSRLFYIEVRLGDGYYIDKKQEEMCFIPASVLSKEYEEITTNRCGGVK